MTQKAYHQFPLKTETTYLHHGIGMSPMRFPMHYHEEVEIFYMEKGEIEITAMENTYTMTEGSMLIVGSNHIHGYGGSKLENTDTKHHLFIFKRSVLASLLKVSGHKDRLMPILFNVHFLDADMIRGIQPILDKMEDLYGETDTEVELKKLSIFYEFIAFLLSHGQFEKAEIVDEDAYKKRQLLMADVNHYMENNYTKGIKLDTIATALNYSSYYFSRLFSQYTGITFKKYLLNYQMIMAKDDVEFTELPITEIAYKHGFNSIKTFNRVFKDYFTISPSIYRKRIDNYKNRKK